MSEKQYELAHLLHQEDLILLGENRDHGSLELSYEL